jgi:hypothetical protein
MGVELPRIAGVRSWSGAPRHPIEYGNGTPNSESQRRMSLMITVARSSRCESASRPSRWRRATLLSGGFTEALRNSPSGNRIIVGGPAAP